MRGRYPVMIGTGMKKGFLGLRSKMKSGMDLLIVFTKEKMETGTEINAEDVDGIDVCLHFCDKKSIGTMINVLRTMEGMWDEVVSSYELENERAVKWE